MVMEVPKEGFNVISIHCTEGFLRLCVSVSGCQWLSVSVCVWLCLRVCSRQSAAKKWDTKRQFRCDCQQTFGSSQMTTPGNAVAADKMHKEALELQAFAKEFRPDLNVYVSAAAHTQIITLVLLPSPEILRKCSRPYRKGATTRPKCYPSAAAHTSERPILSV